MLSINLLLVVLNLMAYKMIIKQLTIHESSISTYYKMLI